MDTHDRAVLAERLLASLDDLREEETERLWAEEAQRRLNGFRAGRARAVSAPEVAAQVEQLFPVIPVNYRFVPRGTGQTQAIGSTLVLCAD